MNDAVTAGVGRLVFEYDKTRHGADCRILREVASRRDPAEPTTDYEHLPATYEPLLWIPDAVAWCWAKGGDWREAVEPLVIKIRKLA